MSPGGGGVRIIVGSDERTQVTDRVVALLREQGHQVELAGALRQEGRDWVDAAREVAEAVAGGAAAQGVLFCWTGTGVSMAANKVPGVRAALCVDPGEARGARRWNDANVLAMPLRLTTEALAGEILEAWMESGVSSDEEDLRPIRKLAELEARYAGSRTATRPA